MCAQNILATYEQGMANNPCIEHSVVSPKQRNLFLFDSQQNLSEQLTPLIQSMRPNVIFRAYRALRNNLGKIKRNLFK